MASENPQSLPAHASPVFLPLHSPKPRQLQQADIEDLHLNQGTSHDTKDPPGNLISPAFTPPSTPGSLTPSLARDAPSIPVDSTLTALPKPNLLEKLPLVRCEVRAR